MELTVARLDGSEASCCVAEPWVRDALDGIDEIRGGADGDKGRKICKRGKTSFRIQRREMMKVGGHGISAPAQGRTKTAQLSAQTYASNIKRLHNTATVPGGQSVGPEAPRSP